MLDISPQCLHICAHTHVNYLCTHTCEHAYIQTNTHTYAKEERKMCLRLSARTGEEDPIAEDTLHLGHRTQLNQIGTDLKFPSSG